MDIDEEKLSMGIELVKQCLLPEFEKDIGEQQLTSDNFDVFLYGLKQNLQLIFDIVAKNRNCLLNPHGKTEKFCFYFVLLLNEQCSDNQAPFQTNEKFLIKHLHNLEQQYSITMLKEPHIYKDCLNYYKTKLTGDEWKRNIGALYGFLRFTKVCYLDANFEIKSCDTLFILSVGMNLVEYFDHQYKQYGLKLFQTLLKKGKKSTIIESNIHGAIYEKLMNPLIKVLKDESILLLLFDCIIDCIKIKKTSRISSDWNEIDDLLSELCSKIVTESNTRIISAFFLFVSKLTTISTMNCENVTKSLDIQHWEEFIKEIDKDGTSNWKLIRDTSETSHHIYRWIKKLLQVSSTQLFLGEHLEICYQLKAFHLCYIICVFRIPILIMSDMWFDFIEKIIPVLVNLLKNGHDDDIKQNIDGLLNTFSIHIENNLTEKEQPIRMRLEKIHDTLLRLHN